MRRFAIALALATPLTIPTTASALEEFVDQVPNGAVFSCQTCHVEAIGGEGWNDFGIDILIEGGANPDANARNQNAGFSGTAADYWQAVCGNDPDGDGLTSGEELGDPDCVWAVGDADPAGDVTNPGDVDSPGVDGGAGGGDIVGGCAQTGGSASMVALLALGLLVRQRN
jgi:dopamine beta-monooxygenase